MRRWLPVVMTLVGVAAFGWLAVRRTLAMPTRELRALAAIFLVGYAAWMAWESRISVKEIAYSQLAADRWKLELAIVAMRIIFATMAMLLSWRKVFLRHLRFAK